MLKAVIIAVLLSAAGTVAAAEPVTEVRLYALDCGRATTADIGFLSDTGEYDGKPGAVVVPCFVVRHPKGTLLWDTGLGDKIAENKGGVDQPGIHMEVLVTLAAQLRGISLAPADVTFVAFSHFHFDHTGNANLFGQSTWIINREELAWGTRSPVPLAVDPATFSGYRSAKTKMIDGDEDVFGDRSVRILKAPGHTPGHQVLMVKLKTSGTVILSGDLYHQRENREHRRVPIFNVDRADTLASMDRIETIVRNTGARFVIQHDSRDFATLPKFPAYLD